MARKVKKPRKTDVTAANRRVLRRSIIVVIVMFAFGFISAPFYDTICRALGVGGKTGRIEADAAAKEIVDTSRTVTVEFTGHAMAGLPWEFHPLVRKVQVHPGETTVVKYFARNPTRETVIGQAVPSVTPAPAGAHFNKVECFCFTQQKLAPGETREMEVRFIVDKGLPLDVRTITLSYGFFNSDPRQARRFGADEPMASPTDSSGHVHDAVSGS